MHTNSFLKDCKFIIHATGITLFKTLNNENKAYFSLHDCFLKILKYSDEKLQINSIAFPFNNNGLWYIEISMCCKVLFKSIKNFYRQQDINNSSLKSIKIICNDDQSVSKFIEYFYTKSTLNKIFIN